MKIITLTLNPAFDVHCEIENLQLHQENYGTRVSRQAGGKGINVSRALHSYGIKNTAITVVGTENGEEFTKGLEKDGISYLTVPTQGRIRENLTVHSKDMPETRISFEGFCADESVLHQIMERMSFDEKTIVTFTGRIPAGLSKEAVISFLHEVRKRGARLVIDCNSFSLEELIALKPMMIKPNQQEISHLAGREMEPERTRDIAEHLTQKGIDHALVSFGEKGMVYHGVKGHYQIFVPEISVVSTVGAGDSTVAGFLAGLTKELPFPDVLRLSAAFGTAACKTSGTNPPVKEEIDLLFHKIKCVNLG